MKTFLVTTLVLLLISIVASVLVFWYVQNGLSQDTEIEMLKTDSAGEPGSDIGERTDNGAVAPSDQEEMSAYTSEADSATAVAEETQLEKSSIPLRDLPLSDTQISLIEGVGVDVATYEITPDTITCAENALGQERFAEIIDGNSPSGFEMLRLVPCL